MTKLITVLLIFFCSLTTVAQEERSIKYDNLKKIVETENVRDIDSLVQILKNRKYIFSVTYIRKSQADDAEDVDDLHPRVIIQLDYDTLISFTGKPKGRFCNKLRVMEYTDNRFVIREIEFTPPAKPVFHESLHPDSNQRLQKHSMNDPTLQNCLKCHGADPMPKWDFRFNRWKHAYGENEGRIEPGSDEEKKWNEFQRTTAKTGRYSLLPATVAMDPESSVARMNYSFGTRVELRNSRRIIESEMYPRKKYELLSKLIACSGEKLSDDQVVAYVKSSFQIENFDAWRTDLYEKEPDRLLVSEALTFVIEEIATDTRLANMVAPKDSRSKAFDAWHRLRNTWRKWDSNDDNTRKLSDEEKTRVCQWLRERQAETIPCKQDEMIPGTGQVGKILERVPPQLPGLNKCSKCHTATELQDPQFLRRAPARISSKDSDRQMPPVGEPQLSNAEKKELEEYIRTLHR